MDPKMGCMCVMMAGMRTVHTKIFDGLRWGAENNVNLFAMWPDAPKQVHPYTTDGKRCFEDACVTSTGGRR